MFEREERHENKLCERLANMVRNYIAIMKCVYLCVCVHIVVFIVFEM